MTTTLANACTVEVYWSGISDQREDGAKFILIGQNVTERKQMETSLQDSEARFRSIFVTTTAAMIVARDDQGTIMEWNTGAENVFGYTIEEAVGQPLTLLIPEYHHDAHRNGYTQAAKNGGLVHGNVTHEVSGIRKTGEEFPMELTLGSWKQGDRLYFSAVILDNSERKLAEQALRRSPKMNAIGQLTGGIAHDFNNILNIILGNAELLKRSTSDEQKRLKRIDAIEKTVHRAADLTRQLLGFSRTQAAKVFDTDINEVIGGMDSLIARSVTPEIKVEYRLAQDLWETEIDPGDFQDTLLNLVLNARDAMQGGGQLSIETTNTVLDSEFGARGPGAASSDYVQLIVSDSGTGIPPEQLEHVFEPFFTTKEQGKGTGLGLAMVFGFIQRSRGHIRTDSRQNIGTRFRLYLPRATGTPLQTENVLKSSEALCQGNETILVVDDEDFLRELAEELLQGMGYNVLTAGNGEQALEVLAQESGIDLLFTDIVMPGDMNGYGLAEHACKNQPRLKVLFASGYTEETLAGQDKTRFSATLLSKPYTPAELGRQVRAVLDG